MFTIGCHVSVSGGYEMMGKTTLAIGGNTFQYFTRNPRGSRGTKAPSEADVAALRALMEENHFAPALAHAPYTYNPASKDENIRQYTRDAMAEELRFLEALPGSLYNFHPGCHVGQGMETAIVLIADLLNAYRDAVENLSGATFGSVQLFDLEQLLLSFRQTAKELKLIAE